MRLLLQLVCCVNSTILQKICEPWGSLVDGTNIMSGLKGQAQTGEPGFSPVRCTVFVQWRLLRLVSRFSNKSFLKHRFSPCCTKRKLSLLWSKVPQKENMHHVYRNWEEQGRQMNQFHGRAEELEGHKTAWRCSWNGTVRNPPSLVRLSGEIRSGG